MNNVRFLPLVAFAALCLLGLKTASMLLGDRHALFGSAPAGAGSHPEKGKIEALRATDNVGGEFLAKRAKRRAEKRGSDDTPVNGDNASVSGRPAKSGDSDSNAAQPAPSRAGPLIGPSKGEIQVLQSLAKRRRVLEKRERELMLRENLLKAAETRVGKRIAELKGIETRITAKLDKDKARKDKSYNRLVQMYAKMKSKDAARIFNRLDLKILTGLAQSMKPQRISAIVALMAPEKAERLTLAIVQQTKERKASARELPKIKSVNPG